MSFGGGSGSSSSISTSTDVALNNPANNDALIYDSTLQKWKNAVSQSAPVSSVAGRTGAITLAAADVSGVLASANNLSDVASASAVRTNLGLGTAATMSATAGGDLSGTLPSPTVARVNGVAVTGTPSNGQVLTAGSSSTASWQAPAVTGLTTVAVQTANYSVNPNELVPIDATAAGLSVTLPAAPVDKARVTIKKIDATTNIVTVACGGSDVLNKSGGSTTATLSLTNQSLTLQYYAASAIWYVVSDDIPLSQLDNRYPKLSIATAKGDLLAASAAGVVSRLGIGADGQALVADSSQVTGLKYAGVRTVYVGDTAPGVTPNVGDVWIDTSGS
jgi:hypothetical protein